MMNIILQPATKDDVSFCFELTKANMKESFEVNWGGWSDSVFQKHFSPTVSTLILQNGRRIGYYSLSEHDTYWCLDDIQLLADETGKGVGTHVLRLIFETVIRSDVKRLHLTVFKNNPAMRLYGRLGFVIIKEKETSVLMEKV